MRRLNQRDPLVGPALERDDIRKGVPVTVDLAGAGAGSVIGFRARKHAGLIDLRRLRHYRPDDFWHRIQAGATLSWCSIRATSTSWPRRRRCGCRPITPPRCWPTTPPMGEFRVHYAGFFDPGFGRPGGPAGPAAASADGTRAVLEVRSHEVPFVLEDGQRVGRLIYERLIARPERLYGTGIGSSYQRQGLALSKHFRLE